MLTAVAIVTLSVADLPKVEDAYARFLDYRTVSRGSVSADLARLWNAPAVEGRAYVLMQPASGERVYLRLVESPPTPGYAPMRTFGWNANEILVQDPDEMAAALAHSPFRVVGPPQALSSNAAVRAMQAIGPADELIYLTRIPPTGSVFIKTPPKARVDRTFIVVLGGPDMQAMQAFWRDTLRLPVSDVFPARVTILNEVHGLDPEFQIPLSLATMPPGFAIEIDEYPPLAGPRPQRPGDLPPGMAMVSFRSDSAPGAAVPWVAPPRAIAEAPYHGAMAGLVVGPAGEWVEVIGPQP